MAEASFDRDSDSEARAAPARSWSLELRGFAAVLLPGSYAWGATVAWPTFAASVPSPVAKVAAVGALLALGSGPWVARRWLKLGRAIGILGFAGLSAAAWGALDAELRPPRLDPVRSALGGLGWGMFALGWGNFPGRTRLPEDDPHVLSASRLIPHARLPISTQVAFGALFVLVLGVPFFAWRVERPGVALLAHAAALAAAVALGNVGTRVLLAPAASERLPASPGSWSWLLLLWLALGALLWLV